MILTARWILPIDSAPLSWGAVRVEGERITAVGPQAKLLAESGGDSHLDLGNAILLPGFVNAHSHLDYTHLRVLGSGLSFPEWLGSLIRRKMSLSSDDYLEMARVGASECLRSGITTVADCTDSGRVAQALSETGLRGIVYPEIFGVDDRDPMERSLAALSEKEKTQRPWISDRICAGISPHAPYTVRAALFEHLNYRSAKENLPLAIHLAESVEEVLALLGERPWKSALREEEVLKLKGESLGISARRDGVQQWAPPGQRPVAYMDRLGLLRPGVTFIHCVQTTHSEIDRLAESGAGVVSCPRSNGFLRTGTAPLRVMIDRGVRLGLGTDGACSSGPISLFEEMRAAWFIHRATGSDVSTAELARLATLGGAEALGMDAQIGSLSEGKLADLTAISLDDPAMRGCDDPHDALVLCGSSESVLFAMVGGRILHDPRRIFGTTCANYG